MKFVSCFLVLLVLVVALPLKAQAEADSALVRQVQQALTVLGYNPGPVDGADGPKTRGALAEFLKSRNLPPESEPSRQLYERMRAVAKAGGKTIAPFKPILDGVNSPRFQSRAKRAILLEADTGRVLYEKNADRLFPPASMSKLMTFAVIFQGLKSGHIREEDRYKTAPRIWSPAAAVMLLSNGERTRVADLLRGGIVESANDAALTLAVGYAGSERVFAKLMERQARRLGLFKSTFGNATGMPHHRQRMTARELAKLAAHIIGEYPHYYPLFSMKDFKFGKEVFRNRNPLLYRNVGVDGLKTGYTRESGYGLVGSGVRGGKRLIFVVSGLKTKWARKEEGLRLFQRGWHLLAKEALLPAGARKIRHLERHDPEFRPEGDVRGGGSDNLFQ